MEYEIVADGIGKHLRKRTYLGDGKEIDQLLTIDSIPDGYYRELENGIVTTSGTYANGKMDSIWKYFFPKTGKTYKSEYFILGKLFGEERTYYDNGKLHDYIFRNVEGIEIFHALFDLDQRIISSKGFPVYVAFNRSNLKYPESFELMCFLAKKLPAHLVSAELKVTDENEKLIWQHDMLADKSLRELPFARKFLLEESLTPGQYKYHMSFSLYDTAGVVVAHDTLTIQVVVKIN